MTPTAQLEWEERAARPATAAALGAAIFILVGSGVYLAVAVDDPGDDDAGRLIAVDAEPADFLVASGINGIGIALVGVVLAYLYRATKHRRPELPRGALYLAVGGAVAVAALGVISQVQQIDSASEFVGSGPQTEARAEDLRGASGLLAGLGLAATLALAGGTLLIALNAMRAGLLGRFMGIASIVIAVLFVLPLGGPLLLFWLGALGLLFLDRWPGGRGPAWSTGEATPWPTAAERAEAARLRQEEQAGQAEQAGGAAPDAEPDERRPPPETSPPPGKRKRKRRR